MKRYFYSYPNLCKRKNTTMTDKITKREMQILKLIANENTIEQIARELNISTSTVESHRRNMFQKMGVKTSIGLLKEAIKRNWISADLV